jgi:hypothetical protein
MNVQVIGILQTRDSVMTTVQLEPKIPAHLDFDFAGKGELIINMPDHEIGVGAGVDTDANNNIVYVANSDRKFVIGRIRPNGEPDLTFADESQLKDEFAEGYASSATSVSVMPGTGRILLSGGYTGKMGYLPAFALFDSNGRYVREFGNEGKVIVALPLGARTLQQSDESAQASVSVNSHPVVTNDGGILFVSNGYIIRLKSDGSTDEGFNHGMGYINVTHAEYQLTTNCLLQTDPDFILVGGIARVNGKHFGMMARYHMTGELDTNSAKNGFYFLTSLKAFSRLFKLVAIDKKRVIGIGSFDSESKKGLLICVDENGETDLNFNSGAPLLTPDDAIPHFVWNSGAVDTENRVLTVSDSMTNFDDLNAIAIARYLPNGSPDTSFAPRIGWTRAKASQGEAISVDTLGRVVVIGTTAFTENLKRPKLLRFIA